MTTLTFISHRMGWVGCVVLIAATSGVVHALQGTDLAIVAPNEGAIVVAGQTVQVTVSTPSGKAFPKGNQPRRRNNKCSRSAHRSG